MCWLGDNLTFRILYYDSFDNIKYIVKNQRKQAMNFTWFDNDPVT